MSTAPAEQNTPAAKGHLAPDPARGVFETLLVKDGQPVELDAHLARLAASLTALYGAEPPRGLGAEVRERARECDLARLRIVVAPTTAEVTPRPSPDSAGERDLAGSLSSAGNPKWRIELTIEAVDRADVFPGRERAADLRSLPCAGGLGRHKWADRRPLEAVAAPTVPLLTDRDDEVLEAGRANVFAVRRGALFTPADDGRILPGVARAGAIAAAREIGIEVREGLLTRADLFAADEVFLTGSVRGVEPAGTLDGAPLPSAAALSERIAAELRRRWRTGRQMAARS
jgi:para-aminobenzoate synthetase/4-amino-4-deoxychorismate lyase